MLNNLIRFCGIFIVIFVFGIIIKVKVFHISARCQNKCDIESQITFHISTKIMLIISVSCKL